MTKLSQSSRISVSEICSDLGLGRESVYQMLHDKTIPAIRRKKLWLITRSAYEEWKRNCGRKQEESLREAHQ